MGEAEEEPQDALQHHTGSASVSIRYLNMQGQWDADNIEAACVVEEFQELALNVHELLHVSVAGIGSGGLTTLLQAKACHQQPSCLLRSQVLAAKAVNDNSSLEAVFS